MKFRFLFASFLAGALSMSAQGYKDGVEYFKVDQFDDAKTLLERNLNDPSTDKAAAYYYLGAIDLFQKNLSGAKANFDKGIQADPKNGLNYVGLGKLALMQGNDASAEDYFKQAISMNKKNAKVINAITRAYYTVDQVKYAKQIEKYMAQALKANKQEPEIFVLQGDMKTDEKQWGDAGALYENAILYDQGNPEAYVKYARTYFNVNPEYAINKLKELLQLKPESALAQRELAEKYYENDQLTRAAEQYGKYIQNPNHFKKDEQRYVGLLYFGKKYDESYALAQKLLNEDPNNFFMQRMLFLNKAAMKDYKSAAEQAEKFFANGKGQYVANDYSTYGSVLQELGNDSLAVMQFEKAVEVNPDKAELLKDLSSAYNKAKNYQKSAEAYQQFVDKGDYVTNDLYVLAGRYMTLAATSPVGSDQKKNAVDNAIKYIDIVLEKVPDDYRILQRKARILVTKNDNEPALEVVETYKGVVDMLDKDPQNKTTHVDAYKEAYNNIGNYYLSQKDNATAKVYFEKFLEIDPGNEALREFLGKL